jgi:hypothetical protein
LRSTDPDRPVADDSRMPGAAMRPLSGIDRRDANSIFPAEGLRVLRDTGFRKRLKDERQLGTIAKWAALLPLVILLAACADGEDRGISFTDDRGTANQPYPANYKAEMLAFLRTYLNDPVGVREASMAEPVQRTVGGRLRYVSCLRYNARESDGSYQGAHEHGVVYVDGRLDRIIENVSDTCAGAVYAPFPEMEKLTR